MTRPPRAALVAAAVLAAVPIRGAAQSPGEPGTRRVESVVYAVAPTEDGPMELVMDLYRPASETVKGAVVLAHGGGFTGGHRTLMENADYGAALASRGYLAAAISYRLFQDRPVVEEGWGDAYARMVLGHEDPRVVGALERLGDGFAGAVAAAAVDQAAAVGYLRGHADALGFDPDDIALFGASAGAISALTLAYARHLHGAENLDVAAVIDLRGLVLLPEAAPNPFDAADPPLLLLHGEDDRSVPLGDAEAVFAMAREAGVSASLHVAPDTGHELGAAGLLARRLDGDRTVLDRIDAFLSAAFEGRPDPGAGTRTRLLPARDDGPRPPGLPTPGADPGFRAELAEVTRSLVDAVSADPPFIGDLYGVSRPALLTHDATGEARRDWSYWPRSRPGLPLGLMTAEQRALTHRLLRTLLSAKGYLEVQHVVLLEEILAQRDTEGFERGVADYHLAVFGDPRPDGAWALRFEGHHVSLNITVLPDRVSVTPSFLGAAPAPLDTGIRAGFTPLGHVQRWAFRLLDTLDPAQRVSAVVGDAPPSEILGTQFQRGREEWDRWQARIPRSGVAASTFRPEQRELLRRLLREVVESYADEISRPRLEALDLDRVVFAWLGSTRPERPHYFRVQGETFVYEFDAAQDGGRHVHTVWRDRADDFGGDALEEHYRRHGHP